MTLCYQAELWLGFIIFIYFFLVIPDAYCWKIEVWITSSGILRQWQSGRRSDSGCCWRTREQLSLHQTAGGSKNNANSAHRAHPVDSGNGLPLWSAPRPEAQFLPGLRRDDGMANRKIKSKRRETGWGVCRHITGPLTLPKPFPLSGCQLLPLINRNREMDA